MPTIRQATSTTTVPWTTWFWPGHSTFFSSAIDSLTKRQGFARRVAAAAVRVLAGAERGARPRSASPRHQRDSRCGGVRPHQRQNFLNSTRSGVFRFDFVVW